MITKSRKQLIEKVELLHEQVTELEGAKYERKRPAEELQEKEDNYRQFIELSPDFIAILSESNIVHINSAGVKSLGATNPEQVLGKPMKYFLHPDYHGTVLRRIQKGQHQIITPCTEQKFIRLDGSDVDVEVKATPLIYQGKPAMQVIAHDITKHKQAENKLSQRSEELEQFKKLVVGRELEMAKLKERVTELEKELAEQKR